MDETERGPPARRSTPWQGLFWPLLSLAGGLAVYYGLFRFFVDPLAPSMDYMRAADYRFLWEMAEPPGRAAILAADINARYAQGIPTVLMTLVFVAALAICFRVVLPRFGRAAVALGVLALPVGGLVGYFEQYNNPVRAGVANCDPATGWTFCPLDQAVARAGEAGTFRADSLERILLLTHWNSVVSVAAIFLLGNCFLFVARQARPDELAPELLRRRRRALTATVGLAGLILVFSVATADAFYNIAPALMAPQDAPGAAGLALAGATYWGAVYTTVMIAIAVPATVSIIRDIQRASHLHRPDHSYAARKAWRAEHGLAIDLRDALGPVLASLTPVLTAPVLDILRGTLAVP